MASASLHSAPDTISRNYWVDHCRLPKADDVDRRIDAVGDAHLRVGYQMEKLRKGGVRVEVILSAGLHRANVA